MASRARLAADDELSEIVRRRLQTLLAEIPPRRATRGSPEGEPSSEDETSSRSTPPSRFEPSRYASDDEVASDALPKVEQPPTRLSATRLADPDDDASHDEPTPFEVNPPRLADDGDGSLEHEPRDPTRPTFRRPFRMPELGTRARQFVREHLVVIGIIVLAGCLWGGYSLFQARTTAVAAPAPVPVQVSVATPSPPPATMLLVHVLGEVKRPGVVSLRDGARVQDALKAAGGLTDRAAPGDLNLAARVSDGTQLVIGRKGSPVRTSTSATGSLGAAGAGGNGGVLDLNAATAEQLDTLPGVGPVTAQKILAWRAAHGRFRSVPELQEVDGIGPKSYAQIAPNVRV